MAPALALALIVTKYSAPRFFRAGRASVIGALGMLVAFLVYAAVFSGVSAVIRAQAGVALDLWSVSPVMIWAPLGMTALCALSGLVPAYKAYETDVAAHLSPTS